MPAHNAQEGVAGGQESTVPSGEAIPPDIARALLDARAKDPNGVRWNAVLAAGGLPPTRPPWLTEEEWRGTQSYAVAHNCMPVSTRPYRGTAQTRPAPDMERRLHPDQQQRGRYSLGTGGG